MCGAIPISSADRDRIAALNAKYRTVSRSPFGEGDEIGMVNLMDASSIQQVMSEADFGKVFDLAVDYFIYMPSWTGAGDPPFQIWMSHTPSGTVIDDPMKVGKAHNELVAYSGDCITMYTHCGTHMDTLNHFGYNGTIWNGFTEKDHLGSRYWDVAGADKHPPIIARGVLIDVAGLHNVPMLPENMESGKRTSRLPLSGRGPNSGPATLLWSVPDA